MFNEDNAKRPAKDLGICMIGHRGYSSKYFMNTELAFTKAAEHGSGGCETDIRKTTDGVYVCSHNSTAILADGTELVVSESSYEQLTAQPLLNPLTDDVIYLCTMRRYLEIMRDNNMICFLELKGDYNDDELHEIFGMVEEVYALDKCIMQSFSIANLLRTRAMFPGMPLMITYGAGDNPADLETCLEQGFSLDVDLNVVTRRMIDRFHQAGLEVALWTANTEEAFKFSKTLGIDYIESDVFGGLD